MARPTTTSESPAPVQTATTLPQFIVPLGRGARGKSWWARWAIERAQSQGREIVVADADRTNPTLSSYFEGGLSSALR
jgi:hypothetical protein